jgi:hypothetical protein
VGKQYPKHQRSQTLREGTEVCMLFSATDHRLTVPGRLSTAIALMAALTACGDVAAPPDLQQREGMLLSGSNVVRYPIAQPVLSSVSVQGARNVDGTCRFQHSVKLGKGQSVFESVSEYDPDTCSFVVVRHDPALLPTFARHSDSTAQLQTQAAAEDGESYTTDMEWWAPQSFVDDCATQIGLDLAFTQILWIQDPPGLNVNRSTQNGFFFYTGSCVQYARTVYQSWWFPSGWYLTGHFHDVYPLWNWEQVNGDGASYMRNDTFCAGQTTYANYDLNRVKLFYDGYVSFEWWFDASGACSSLLTRHRSASVGWS